MNELSDYLKLVIELRNQEPKYQQPKQEKKKEKKKIKNKTQANKSKKENTPGPGRYDHHSEIPMIQNQDHFWRNHLPKFQSIHCTKTRSSQKVFL